jgi:hypothetical protein
MFDIDSSEWLDSLWNRYDKIKNSLPTPITETYDKFLNISTLTDRGVEKKIIDTFEVILKLITSIMVAKYVEDGVYTQKIDNQISQLMRPSIGSYKAILRVIVNHYKKLTNSENENTHFVNETIDFLSDEISPECFDCLKLIVSKLSFPPLKNNENKIDALLDTLVTYRNNLSHGADKSDKSYKELIPSLFLVIIELTEKFKERLSYQLIYIESKTQSKGVTKYNRYVLHDNKPRVKQIESKFEFSANRIYLKFDGIKGEEFIDISSLLFWKQCNHEDCNDQFKFYYFNGIKKNAFIIFPYDCSHKCTFGKDTFEYTSFMENKISKKYFDLQNMSGESGYVKEFPTTDYSKMLFKRAKAEFFDGDYYQAIDLSLKAMNDSLMFRDANYLLLECYLKIDKNEMAQDVIDSYINDKQEIINLDLYDIMLLEKNRNMQLNIQNDELANEIFEQMKLIIIENSEAISLKEIADIDQITDSTSNDDIYKIIESLNENIIIEDTNWNVLPYEIVWSKILSLFRKKDSQKSINTALISKLCSMCMITIISFLLAFLFNTKEDILMSLTSIGFGIFWGVIVHSNYKMYKLILESHHNVNAFINKLNFEDFYNEIISNIFGDFTCINKAVVKRLSIIVMGALVFTTLIYHCTMFKIDGPESPLLNISYYIFIFFINIDFMYLFCNLASYNGAINSLRKENIDYSISQPSRFSIKYLSILSRKITYQFIYVYISFCLLMFMAPIKSNIAYIGIFIFMLGFIAYVNIISNKIIKIVINENKRKLLSKFSTHFDVPFNQFISKASTDSYNKIIDLIEMRKFIESINIVGESKFVLFLRGFLFIFIIFFTMSFASILMTKGIVPKISKLDEQLINKRKDQTRTQSFDIQNPNPEITLVSEDVDDSVVMLFFSDINELETLLVDTDFDKKVKESENLFHNLLPEAKDKEKISCIFKDFDLQNNNGSEILPILSKLLKNKLICTFDLETIEPDVTFILDNLQKSLSVSKYTLNEEMNGNHYVRNDWDNGGDSPRLEVKFPMNADSLFIVSLAFNKVYIPPTKLIGGGKLSFKITIDIDDHQLINTSSFLRTNVFGLGFVSMIKLVKQDNEQVISFIDYRGLDSLKDFEEVTKIIEKIRVMMSQENNAKISI